MSKIYQRIQNYGWKSALIIAFLSIAATPAVLAADKKLPEISSDGLHLLKNTKVRVAYAKPGATLDKYTKVKILDCFVQFEKNWQRDYNMQEIGLSNRVSDKDTDRIKKQLSEEFTKVFTKVLTKEGYPVVDETGPDVLLLRPAILNLKVTAPDVRSASMSDTYVASAGQMTLYMEMYDSQTETLLARVVDPRADQGRGGIAMAANRVTNKAEADRIISRWAKLLSDHLGDVSQPAAD